jgi:hypothetical protein
MMKHLGGAASWAEAAPKETIPPAPFDKRAACSVCVACGLLFDQLCMLVCTLDFIPRMAICFFF